MQLRRIKKFMAEEIPDKHSIRRSGTRRSPHGESKAQPLELDVCCGIQSDLARVEGRWPFLSKHTIKRLSTADGHTQTSSGTRLQRGGVGELILP